VVDFGTVNRVALARANHETDDRQRSEQASSQAAEHEKKLCERANVDVALSALQARKEKKKGWGHGLSN
jgi:flagellar motility protein MotE (MotC chaperone)